MGALKHLVSFHAGTGITIVEMSFLDEACMDENTSVLFSGIIRAIQDLMSELKLGDMKAFETHENVIAYVQRGAVVVALLMERGTDASMFSGKLVSVATAIDEFLDWSTWTGEVTQFDPLKARVRQIMLTSPAETCQTAGDLLRGKMATMPALAGFVIARGTTIQDSHFASTGDFELDALIQSPFMHQFIDKTRAVAAFFHHAGTPGHVSSTLAGYGKFSVEMLLLHDDVECFLIFRGTVDPLAGPAGAASITASLGAI